MLISRFHLPLANSLDGRVLRCADRTLSIFIHLVQTALVEGVFAEEVDCWEVEAAATGHAPACLKDDGFGA